MTKKRVKTRSRRKRDWRQIVFLAVSLLIVLSMALAFLPILTPGP